MCWRSCAGHKIRAVASRDSVFFNCYQVWALNARLLDSTSEGDAINAIREFKPPSTTIDHWSDFIETISLLLTESVGWPHALEAELSLAHKLPSLFGPKHHVEAGGLMSYSPDRADLWRRGALYVDKILRGIDPADLPVQQSNLPST